ncbi:MAG TPA: hypothetical protein VGL54_03220 [Solirubrobacteraceae bacterium]
MTASLTFAMASVLTSPALAAEAFGVESFASSITSNEGGTPATQAGSHPYAVTTSITFNHVVTEMEEEEPPRVRTYGDPKDIEVNLPPGVIVSPSGTEARCTEAELESGTGSTGCPNAAAVGVFSVYLDGIEVLEEPVYNMQPPAGVPAELGFDAAGIGLIMHVGGRIRTGGDYGLSADISDIPDEHPIYGLKLTLWGDPSAASHDQERGLCADGEAKHSFKQTQVRSSCPVERIDTPFLTLPSSCTGESLTTTLSTDSWQQPGALNPDGTPDLDDPRWRAASATSLPLTGCEGLTFGPALTVNTAEPEAAHAESPSGLDVDVKLPSEESVSGAAGADLREAVVTLPAGFAISPSAGGGRAACTPEEIELGNAKVPTCPEAATVGTARIETPLLEDPLEGSLYLAQPYANEAAFGSPEHPGGSLLALYLVAEGDGLLVKLAGRVEADPGTGRLTVRWANLPQLPIGEIKLGLSGGERALLVTPAACGVYAASASLAPWSGTPAVTQTANIEIDSGPGGGACPNERFSPAFTAGTLDNRAGASSAFTLTLSREDGEQHFGAFTVKLPAGLSGALGDVPLCPEPQASLGDCPQASAIGAATVSVGPGADPFYLPEPGRQASGIYLTGPVPSGGSPLPEGSNPSGAPFGLSIVVPAIVGPFDLGTVVVRASVAVDPRTAQLTIASVSGVGGIPTVEDGIPLDIRTLELTIDRPNLIFNPTSCASKVLAATIVSASGTNASASSPFQAADCASLPFKPKLTALTHARPSKTDGDYLHVKIASGPGQADLGKVKIDLPRQLPGRLTTLQKACPATVFETNPAACPAASIVGTATIVTPMLASALIGPAYLVSHGVGSFPSLVLALQGDGVRIDLEGQTDIRNGITSSAFRALPDVPISTLDLVLPAGPHSVFAVDLPGKAKGGLCAQTLKMPAAFTDQNGVQLKQTARIAVSGCPRAKRAKRAKGARRAKGGEQAERAKRRGKQR